MSQTALAQTATPAAEQIHNFDVPAGPLDAALDNFARAAGVNLTYDAALVSNKRSPGLSGNHGVSAALTLLLAGSGLEAVAQPRGGYLLQISAAEAAVTLAPVKVAGTFAGVYSAAEEVVQGNRLGQTVVDTPRAVSVVTRELIEDVRPRSEAELMRYVAGISQSSDYQGLYSSFALRGLTAGNGTNYLRDGARIMHVTEPLLFNVDRIEVIKGPNAIDFGQTAPGGLINYVSKRPKVEAVYALSLSAGEDSLGKGEFDLTGPANESRTLLYRLTGAYETGGAYTDYVDPERRGAALSLSWNPAEGTTINASIEDQSIEQRTNPGLPVPDPENIRSVDAIDANRFYGEKAMYFRSDVSTYQVEFLQDLGADWQTRLLLAREEFSRPTEYIVHGGLSADAQNTTRVLWHSPVYDIANDTARFDLRGRVVTGDIEHQLLIGAEALRTRGAWANWELVDLPELDLYHPQLSSTPIPAAAEGEVVVHNRGTGVFVQDVMDFGGGWGLQFGLRHERVKEPERPESASKTSPNIALTFKPDEQSLLYASYATSFEPNYGVRLVDGGNAEPSEGRQLELGTKRGWLGGALTTTAALFQLERTNIATADNDHPGYSSLAGEVRIRGLEIEASGELVPGWNLIAQATFLDPEVIYDGNAAVIGNQPARSTKQTRSLWSTYRLPGALDAWQIGAGIAYKGKTPVDNANSTQVPSYIAIDGFAAWDVATNLRLALNVRNLTDKRYYADASGSNGQFISAIPGQPRTFVVTADIKF